MNWTNKIYQIFIVLITSLCLLEIVFQFLPVSESSNLQNTNVNNHILYFKPNAKVRKTLGPFFNYSVVKATNDMGYFSDENRRDRGLKKVVLVVGDSFVEASHVANKNTFHGILPKHFPGYTFLPMGVSGSPLSQYLAFIEDVKTELDPELFIIPIISNDFDESLAKNNLMPGFYQYDSDFNLVMRQHRTQNWYVNFLSKSAFIGYLYRDFKIISKINAVVNGDGKKNALYKDYGEDKFEETQLVINKFILDLHKIVGETRVLFILDSDRSALYRKHNVDTPRYFPFSNYIKDAYLKFKVTCCENSNFHFIDMSNVFEDEIAKNRKLLDFSDVADGHWNERGHLAVSRTVQEWMQGNGF
ncbi:hypothetical protein N9C80_01380 [Paracoccaceae bacterium]|nr:hypothetical protein [Paracoccaceae bacterium]